ncbi:MAG TPA: NHL repeat-containing protein [bacterium]|nr:NHL repeat-containing protein [bacterium]
MRRISLLILVGLLGLTQINCGSKSSPSAPVSSEASYSFITDLSLAAGTPLSSNVPLGVAASNGKIYVGYADLSGVGNYYISVFDRAGNFLAYFSPYSAYGDPIFAGGLSVDKFGHLYMADYYNATIHSFNIDAIPATISGEAVTAAFTYNGICSPTDVKTDASGILYVADSCGAIYSLYQHGNNPGFGTSNVNGSVSINGGDLGSGVSFSGPLGIAVNPAGTRIYVSEPQFNVVQVYDGDFNWLSVIGDPSGAPSTATGKFDGPEAVALDNAGNLFVTDSNNSRVQEFSPSGAYLTSIGNTATSVSNGELFFPVFPTLDENNNLFVTEFYSARTFEYGLN